MFNADLIFASKSFAAKRTPQVVTPPGRRSLDLKLDCPSVQGALIVYVRQNTRLIEDYSTGLRWELPGATTKMLIRVNGSSHVHGNPDRKILNNLFHIHVDIEELFSSPSPNNPRWAFELEDPYTSLPEAFRLLTEVARIATPPFVFDAVRACAGMPTSMQRSLDFTDDDS